ncbi:hypothetical protein [Mycetocola saprophilus]|uniref:hypothetical protein n=1 Tax=Mycetocola saprophilus TaxID=76636 RepID=UPI0004C01CC9|nr:hypothetical protein [Mycetocola saprophilus]
MSRIRLDLVGAVWIDGVALLAGDEVPEGAVVGEHVVEPEGETETVEVVETVAGDEVPEGAPEKPKRGRPRKTESE